MALDRQKHRGLKRVFARALSGETAAEASIRPAPHRSGPWTELDGQPMNRDRSERTGGGAMVERGE